jgi:hypothetical protein
MKQVAKKLWCLVLSLNAERCFSETSFDFETTIECYIPEDRILYKDVLRCSRYSDWLRAGRARVRGLNPGRRMFTSMSSRPALGSTQPHIQWVPGSFRGGKVAGA